MHMTRLVPIVAFMVVTAFGTPLAASTVVLKCIDGTDALDVVGKSPLGPSGIVCDADERLDGACTFSAICPACRYGTRPCRTPCSPQPRYLWAQVAGGRSQKLQLGSQLFVFRCGSPLRSR